MNADDTEIRALTEKDLTFMSQYTSHGKKRFWTKKKAVVGGIAASFLIPAVAYAAVFLFGFGNFTASAATPGQLNVDQSTTKTTKTLAPGQTVGVKGNVTNPNDYDVDVTDLIIKASSVTVTGGNNTTECKVSFATPNSTVDFPAEGSTAAVANDGVQFHLATPVTIPAGNTKEITFPAVIKQDPTATKLCGVTAHYAVKGAVGN